MLIETTACQSWCVLKNKTELRLFWGPNYPWVSNIDDALSSAFYSCLQDRIHSLNWTKYFLIKIIARIRYTCCSKLSEQPPDCATGYTRWFTKQLENTTESLPTPIVREFKFYEF